MDGTCDRPMEHRTSRRRSGRVFQSTAVCYPASTGMFQRRVSSFIFSCALERHGNGFEALKGEEHLDSHPKMTRDLQGEFQAGFVVAAFEITDGLVIDTHRVCQLAPRDTLLRTKNRDSVI